MCKITNPIVIGIVRRCKAITLLLTTCGSAENDVFMHIWVKFHLVHQGAVVRRSDSTIHWIANFLTIVKMLKKL